MAEFHIGGIVDAIDGVDAEAIHHAFLHHHLAAAAILFGRLEQKRHAAGEAARLGQVFGGTKQHGDMAIMAAGMHLARNGRGVFGPGDFVDRQRVHVGAQADGGGAGRIGPLPLDDGDDPGPGDAGMDFIHAEIAQAVDDEGRGVVAIEGQFGMGMQMATPGLHFLGISGDTVEDGHQVILAIGAFDQIRIRRCPQCPSPTVTQRQATS